jgi:hypothetical protein
LNPDGIKVIEVKGRLTVGNFSWILSHRMGRVQKYVKKRLRMLEGRTQFHQCEAVPDSWLMT